MDTKPTTDFMVETTRRGKTDHLSLHYYNLTFDVTCHLSWLCVG